MLITSGPNVATQNSVIARNAMTIGISFFSTPGSIGFFGQAWILYFGREEDVAVMQSRATSSIYSVPPMIASATAEIHSVSESDSPATRC